MPFSQLTKRSKQNVVSTWFAVCGQSKMRTSRSPETKAGVSVWTFLDEFRTPDGRFQGHEDAVLGGSERMGDEV